ncbi:alpha-glucosidase [Candidatus Bipolaricaulota bacterium]|nr:alpha-glucosidase [Candidatus Bipolaricaulota bacterium]MBS3813852.1 alpha-glucosidase [Candidatus Bipolaricaulota bacterium]
MKNILSEGFNIEIDSLDDKIGRLKVFEENSSCSENDVIPQLNDISAGGNSEWGISGSRNNFVVTLDGEKAAEFAGLEKGHPGWGQYGAEESDNWLKLSQLVDEDSLVYGLGEKTRYMEKSGAVYEMWNRDTNGFYTHNEDPLYSSLPFYLVRVPETGGGGDSFLGIYLHQSERSQFAVKVGENSDRIGLAVKSPSVRLYLFLGGDIKKVIENYTKLTGKPFLPPRWAIGYHHSEYGKPCDQEEAIDLADTFREKGIPCDALYFDIQHMEGNRDFTWDREAFPSPEKLTEKLHEMDFHLVNIVDPGIKEEPGYEVYESGIGKDVYVRDEEGDNFSGSVWPGFCVFPDFLRKEVRDWWAEQNRKLLNQGIDGIWNDMNEPAIFFGRKQISRLASTIEEKTSRGGHLDFEYKHRLMNVREENTKSLCHKNDAGKKVSHEKVHNIYALYEAMATEKSFRREKPEERPFILTRAGFSGIQKYAAKWTGDNSSTWEHMKMSIYMALNLGLSGIPFAGADIGGFHGDVEPELLTRWIQLGSVMPFYRNHSSLDTIKQEPWSFGDRYEGINRKYISLRYKLLPFLYTEFFRTSRTGIPVMRPLFMEFPADKESYTTSDQFMVGNSMLVAPILERNSRKRLLYLPSESGRKISWLDWWTGERLESGYHTLDTSLDVMPIFVREGKGIPYTETVQHAYEFPDTLKLRVNRGEYHNTKARVPVYHDDGKSYGFARGNYFLGEFLIEGDHEKPKLEVNHNGYDPFWDKVEVD